MVMSLLIALGACGLAGLAEWRHARRIARVARLAFGPSGKPAAWVNAVPVMRSIAVGLTAWGLVVLLTTEADQSEVDLTQEPSKHVLICLDVSPSMLIEDAGPGSEKVTRAAWAGQLVQGILDRLDMESTRVTVFAVYTDALPVIEETFDKAVITNVLDGLPMYAAFDPGPTDLLSGVKKSLEYTRRWPSDSATLVVVSDGDARGTAPVTFVPASIADAIVIGVGSPHRSTMVSGHSSRQQVSSLKLLAARLGGTYHQGNEKHLPSDVLDGLSMIQPRLAESVGLREVAKVLAAIGASVLGLLGPALAIFGHPNSFRRLISAAEPVGRLRPAVHRGRA